MRCARRRSNARTLHLTALLSVMVTGSFPPTPLLAAPTRPEAVDARTRGETAYHAQRWEEAAEAFAEAYAADPNPAFLYARAQAARQSGDCRLATDLYASFLESGPPTAAARNARDHMAECARVLAAEPQDPAPRGESTRAPERLEDPDAERPKVFVPTPAQNPPVWHRDVAGGVLGGLGLAAIGAGAGLQIGARLDLRASNRAGDEPEYGRRIDRAIRLDQASSATFAVGGALVVAAVVRYIVIARRRAPARAQSWHFSSTWRM